MEPMVTEPGSVPPPASSTSSAAGRVTAIYESTDVPELMCRYPNAPIVKLTAKGTREVTVLLQGEPFRLRVPNANQAIVGRDYLLIQGGVDDGLYLIGAG
jgi:hypothetical protein